MSSVSFKWLANSSTARSARSVVEDVCCWLEERLIKGVRDRASRTITPSKALRYANAEAAERWQLARSDDVPTQNWSSFDRAPWQHPWLTVENISSFTEFSRSVVAGLPAPRLGSHPSFGFVGNMANSNYCRMEGLRRLGMDISLYLHPDDRSVMSQPFWEEFDGDFLGLGDSPEKRVHEEPLPTHTARKQQDPAWHTGFQRSFPRYLRPSDVLAWSEFMGYRPLLDALQSHDALLVSQSFYLGPLSGRPYVIAPTGGDMWFDPSRDDHFGRLVRRALHESFAVLVSNPITLAHARRYGLRNCLYAPFLLDEERYHPGEERALRSEWEGATGGDFFVLTSMRLDNAWKGATTAIEGFARFAARMPNARLVVLGWGVDRQAAMQRLSDLGVADRVLLLPLAGKRRLARYLRAADALMEQFTLGYYGASGLEAMASGLPVVMRLERAQYDALAGQAPPVLDAADPDQVCDRLHDLASSPESRRTVSEASRRWFLKHHSASAWKDTYEALLLAAANNAHPDWTRSPLSAPLGRAEKDWHASQLEGAPPFPQYTI